jgi:hypothetical protein
MASPWVGSFAESTSWAEEPFLLVDGFILLRGSPDAVALITHQGAARRLGKRQLRSSLQGVECLKLSHSPRPAAAA